MPAEPERREQLIAHVQHWFQQERDEALGDLAAGTVLDFFEDLLAAPVYNQGVQDAKALVRRFQATLDDELAYLEKVVPR